MSKISEQISHQRRYMMVNKHMTRSSKTSYIVRELQIKTRKYHYIAVRQVKTQNTDTTKCQ